MVGEGGGGEHLKGKRSQVKDCGCCTGVGGDGGRGKELRKGMKQGKNEI